MPAIVVSGEVWQNHVDELHRSLSVPTTFELAGVRDNDVRRPHPRLPLPGSDYTLCHAMSLAMARGDTPTVSLGQLKEELRHLRKDVCTIDGRRVLTFGQVLDCARRRGLPIRFDQAWGTARHVWFHFDKDLVGSGLSAVQSLERVLTLLSRNTLSYKGFRATRSTQICSSRTPGCSMLFVHARLIDQQRTSEIWKNTCMSL